MSKVDGEIELTSAEMYHGAMVGIMRRIHAVKAGFEHRFSETDRNDDWRRDVGGGFAEVAVAKYLKRYWVGMGTLGDIRAADVSGPVQVRHTFHLDGHLHVYKKDKDDEPFVLCVGDAPVLRVVGWKLGGDCKRDEWYRRASKCYWVPQDALLPMSELP